MYGTDILADKAALVANSNTFKATVQDIDIQIKDLETKIDSIESAWKSDDGIKYVNMLREIYVAQLKTVSKDLYKFATRLEKMEYIYSYMDEQYGKKKIGV